MNPNDLLPATRRAKDMRTKVYVHVQLDPSIVQRLKKTASSRGYRLGEFLELLFDKVLPKEKE